MARTFTKTTAKVVTSELEVKVEIENEKKKKRKLPRLLMIATCIILLGIILPKAMIGVTGLALIKEIMSGEYKTINEILDKITGKKK